MGLAYPPKIRPGCSSPSGRSGNQGLVRATALDWDSWSAEGWSKPTGAASGWSPKLVRVPLSPLPYQQIPNAVASENPGITDASFNLPEGSYGLQFKKVISLAGICDFEFLALP